ncbi:MAG: hypothetical protein E7673_05990 [Ruminococcaceae bacterium]|nr:hypothetical protein [Oscillospiraceae bacterium]
MKKILCLLLTFVLLLACVSCNVIGKKDKEQSGSVETISATVTSSNPTVIVTKVDYITEGEETLTSSYITEKDSKTGVERFTFHTKRYPTVEEMYPESIKELQGTVWKNADGTVKASTGDKWSKEEAVGYLSEELIITKSAFKSSTLTDNGNDLVATIDAKDSVRVFGADVKAAGDITLEIDTNGTYLYKVVVKYTTASGASVVVTTSYDYGEVTIKDN